MIISVHLPKTAGESFAASLKDHFKDKFYKDDHDKPINTPVFYRNTKALLNLVTNSFQNYPYIECIHGHFLPIKYLSLSFHKNVQFITWLRDPVERLASHYYFWLRNYNPQKAPPVYQKMMQEEWSLEQFCFRKEMQNFYSQFLWGFPASHFSFIGIVEYYEEDFRYFQDYVLKEPLTPYKINYNPEKLNSRYITDSVLRERIEHYHQKDIDLYTKVLEQRKRRT